MPRLGLLAFAFGLLIAVAGCAAPPPRPSFDPVGPCTSDGQRPGAYPDIEEHLPRSFSGAAPTNVDSGRNCTDGALGSLAARGIDELRFAGATWETGRASGVTIARFEADGLTVDRMAEFYESGARNARRTEQITTGEVSLGSVRGWRLDAFVADSYQSVVVLPASEPDAVLAVLVASDLGEAESRAAHDARVIDAAEAALAA